MKAIRVHEYGDPEVMRLESMPDPLPGQGQVVVQIRAAGVNPVEAYQRQGRQGYTPALPFTPGTDAGGVVEAVGQGVTRVKAGDRVYIAGSLTGTYAELALCLESSLHPLPERVSFAEGAAVYVPYYTAYRGLFQRAQARPGETVLVHGATGGVGLAAVQLARAAGLTVIATGGTEQGRQLVAKQGAHHVLDHRAPDYLGEIPKLTEGRGVDVIIELASHINLGKDLPILAESGRVVVIGARGPIEINPRDTMGRNAAILGMSLPKTPPRELASIAPAINAALENGTARPVIDKEIPLGEAPRAHRAVMEDSNHLGKIVLIP